MRRHIESKTKKRMSAEDRKKAILETTVSFISQFGFWGFTIRDVAQAQNITEAGLLYYFKSKEQLLEATLKYADRTNQIAIAEHLGVEGVTGEVLQDWPSHTIAISDSRPSPREPLENPTAGPTRNGSPLHLLEARP